MSHLQYFDYEGFGERVRKETHYSQAVRIGNIIKISGQGLLPHVPLLSSLLFSQLSQL